MKRLITILALGVQLACQATTQIETDKDRDGLLGPVRGVLIDDVSFGERAGTWGEIQQVWSTVIYDAAGKKTLQTPFKLPLPGGFAVVQYDTQFNPGAKGSKVEEPIVSPGGKWVKTYDARGYVTEKVRYDASGAQVEKSNNVYESDSHGNWVKRTTSQVTMIDGQSTARPVETSRRLIFYADSVGPKSTAERAALPASVKQLASPLAVSAENLSRGQSLYSQRCAACHGDDGKGRTEIAPIMPVKPSDLTAEGSRNLTDGEIYWLVTEGIKASSMPGLKDRISEVERWQIVLYLRGLQKGQVPDLTTLAAAESEGRQAEAGPSRRAAQPEQRYKFKGKVVSIDKNLRQVTVEHEPIEGYMGAMTMPFPLAEEGMYDVLKPGDLIQATLVVGSGGWRLAKVRVSK